MLPLGLGAAWTPTIVAVQILNLASPDKPKLRAWTLAAGCGLVLLAESALGLLVAVGTGWADGSSTAGAVIKLVAAGLLVIVGIVELRRRRSGAAADSGPPANRGLDRTFALGAWLMATNFSSLVLYFPAVHEIGSSNAGTAAQVVAFVLLYALAMLPVVGPPIVVGLAGDRARVPLERLGREFTAHRHAIAAFVCFGFAALLTALALSDLL